MPSAQIPDSPRTVAYGHPYSGKLFGGVALPKTGAHHIVQTATVARRWVYGTDYLVRSIISTAAQVENDVPNSQPLVIGNLSKKKGGDIDMSRSHNTGRDVDLAYYTANLNGESVKSLYHRFDARGRSIAAPGKYKLDLPRNWALVKALIQNKDAETQWIIVASWIENMLLNYAISIGEPATLIMQAEQMMMVPTWAKPHDNHLHIRMLCSPRDWKRGCVNGGPVWSWNKHMLEAMNAAKVPLVAGLKSSKTKTRKEALKKLARRGIHTAFNDVLPLLNDKARSIRKLSLKVLTALTTEANATHVLEIAQSLTGTSAYELTAKALKRAGYQGLSEARHIVDGTHPLLKQVRSSQKRKLKKLAKRQLRTFKYIRLSQPGGPTSQL